MSDTKITDSERFAASSSGSAIYNDNSTTYVAGSFIPTPLAPVNNCNLPHRHPNFVGRQDEIQGVLNALSTRAWIISIDGIGGIGKTSLALEVAHVCLEKNSNYVDLPNFAGFIWTSARTNPKFCLEDVIGQILYVLSSFELTPRRFSLSEGVMLDRM